MRGDQGIALIHRVVSNMGFVWNPLRLEAGIDGIIEIRDPVTAEVSNCIIQAQSKAGQSYFKAETDTTFEFICDERDLAYWLRGNAPVILIVSRPDKDEAYWISIKDYFRDPKQRQARKITFSKDRDRFDIDCRERLAQIAAPPNSGHYLAAVPQHDTLISNLLPLVSYPKRLFRAVTKLRDPATVWDRINKTPESAKPEWFLHEGFIYAFHDLTFDPWTKICIAPTTQNLATNDFAYSDETSSRYVFLRLARHCLEQILYAQGVRYSKVQEVHYFRATPDLTERKIGGLSVFKQYRSKTNPDRTAYCRHRAADLAFVRFGKQWYLEITPTYRFTQDGWKESRYSAERLRGIKQLERQNKTHLRQVRLWEEVLRQTHLLRVAPEPKQRSMFEGEPEAEALMKAYTLVSFGPLVSFEIDSSVPESAWLARATEEDDDAPGQKKMFE
jgi:hypothetical protein